MKSTCNFNQLFFILCLLLSVASCKKDINPNPPNIIFILADDLGYGDLACYGHPYALTPNIDALASQGAKFTNFYSSGITCSPSRAALMTAQHPLRSPVVPNKLGLGDMTITELLNNAGYATGHVGKWHIGPLDEVANYPYGLDYIDPGESISLEEGARINRDDIIFSKAFEFIEENNTGPFYLNIWTHVSHTLVDPSEKMLEHFEGLEVDETKFGRWFGEEKISVLNRKDKKLDEAMQAYVAYVYSLDILIGKLMQYLKDQNMDQNTIVIFSSDQGPESLERIFDDSNRSSKRRLNEMSERKKVLLLNTVGYAGGLRGGKHSAYEGGVRVPFIVKWPGRIPENYIDDESVISSLDFLPTLCSIVGVDIEEEAFDGLDKSKTWFGTPEQRNEPLFWKSHSKRAPVSILMDRWKMHEMRMGNGVSLYDLENDPFEENDVSSEHENVVEELLEKIDEWESSLPEQERG